MVKVDVMISLYIFYGSERHAEYVIRLVIKVGFVSGHLTRDEK